MTVSRREFIQWSAATAALAATGFDLSASPAKVTPKKILILGGTGYLGPATIEIAQARGHQVTMFNRGKTRPDLFPGVEKLHGDRDPKKGEGLKALETGSWDAVIDNSGYYPRLVGASAALLAPRAKQYLYISSISAYKEPNPENGTEDAPLATLADPTVEDMGKEYANYGGLKALCASTRGVSWPSPAPPRIPWRSSTSATWRPGWCTWSRGAPRASSTPAAPKSGWPGAVWSTPSRRPEVPAPSPSGSQRISWPSRRASSSPSGLPLWARPRASTPGATTAP